SEAIVLIRRPKSEAPPTAVRGALFGKRWQGRQHRWVRVPFAATGAPADPNDPQLQDQWAAAIAQIFEDPWLAPHPWQQFAGGRIATWLRGQPGAKPSAGLALLAARPPRTDMARL